MLKMSAIEWLRTMWLCGMTAEEAAEQYHYPVQAMQNIFTNWEGEAKNYHLALKEVVEPAKLRVAATVTKVA